MKKIMFALMAALAIFAVSCKKDKGEGEDKPQREVDATMAGATVWSVIGEFCSWGEGEVNMTKTSDDPETWFAGSVGLTAGKFKFRGNNEWGDYDLGGGGATIAPGEEFDLQVKNGDIVCAEDGTYEITLYPTLKYCVIKK